MKLSSRGLEGSIKNTGLQDLILGRLKNFDTLSHHFGDRYKYYKNIYLNDIYNKEDKTLNWTHSKFVYNDLFDKRQKNCDYMFFKLIMQRVSKEFENKEHKYYNESLHTIANYCQIYNIDGKFRQFLIPKTDILNTQIDGEKKFECVNRNPILVYDFYSYNGTRIKIDYKEYTHIQCNQVFDIGYENSMLLIDEINDLKYYNTSYQFKKVSTFQPKNEFIELIANCVFDRCRQICENEKSEYKVQDNVFGLDQDEKFAFNKIVDETMKHLETKIKYAQDNQRMKWNDYFFTTAQKQVVREKTLELIQKEIMSNHKIFQQLRPFIRLLHKFVDEKRKKIYIKAYYLFYNSKYPDLVFKIGTGQGNHIQIFNKKISQTISEIQYHENKWQIRDGYGKEGERKPSALSTWRNLTNFIDLNSYYEQSLVSKIDIYEKDSIRCVFKEREIQKEIGPYSIKDGDIVECGQAQYQFRYHLQ